ncbi:class F sortase [Jeotgalibacillus sp. S-D1]|uniref:class F sortase n=1 Tax=Jeotgalibacillus sp. S-D1 TaxID=2552189 RepID=UPI00105969FB|nr:class F sortase [Jeotgalibacillus sp. S-D1]
MKRFIALASIILLLPACAEEGFPDSSVPEMPILNETNDAVPVQAAPPAVNQLQSNTNSVKKPLETEEHIIPSSLSIPSIGLIAPVNPYGLDDSGAMAVPDNGNEVAWFEPGFKPGQKGNAVLAGHVDSEKAPAVFWDLKALNEGDEIIVSDSDGKTLVFEVVKTEIYERNEAPIQNIFGSSSSRKLNLITCTGYFDRDELNYVDRMVVYTELKSEEH